MDVFELSALKAWAVEGDQPLAGCHGPSLSPASVTTANEKLIIAESAGLDKADPYEIHQGSIRHAATLSPEIDNLLILHHAEARPAFELPDERALLPGLRPFFIVAFVLIM